MSTLVTEVFKTNVREAHHAKMLVRLLLEHFPGSAVSFDLEDCDKILLVKSRELVPAHVSSLLQRQGFSCEVLPD